MVFHRGGSLLPSYSTTDWSLQPTKADVRQWRTGDSSTHQGKVSASICGRLPHAGVALNTGKFHKLQQAYKMFPLHPSSICYLIRLNDYGLSIPLSPPFVYPSLSIFPFILVSPSSTVSSTVCPISISVLQVRCSVQVFPYNFQI